MDDENFVKRMREAADLAGGQVVLAEKTGISDRTINSYATGGSDPSRTRLVAIAKAAGLYPGWLASGQGPKFLNEDQVRSEKERPIRIAMPLAGALAPEPCFVDFAGNDVSISAEATDPNLFDYVPMVETQLSAGGGCFVLSENIEGYYAFRKSWLRRIASSIKSLVLMRVQGRSMDPTIQDGDTVMIDTGRQVIKEGLLYALRFDSTVMIKRLSFRPGGRVQVISDNRQEYDPFETDLKDLHVIGQIVFFCRTFVQK